MLKIFTTFLLLCIIQVFAHKSHPELNLQVADPEIADKCFTAPSCNFKYKYRTLDGSCNNKRKPFWGQADTAMVRLLPPRYADGVSSLPVSVSGESLPSTRNISGKFFNNEYKSLVGYAATIGGWGQIIAHDTSFSISQPDKVCCSNGQAIEDEGCAGVAILPDDPFYSLFNRTCMDLPRTRTTNTIKCNVKPVQQISPVTHFHDLSIVYGSNDTRSNELRAMHGGRLKITVDFKGNHYCPHAPSTACEARSKSCYKAGDPRVNQNLDLAAFQTIFLREHNRVADELQKINPFWSDETLFQEARRVTIAEVQEISFYEFLPTILGAIEERRRPRLFTKYDERVNPSTINEFTAGCYRLLHSAVRNANVFMTDLGIVKTILPLSLWFERPDFIERDMSGLLVGLTRQPSQHVDHNYSNGVRIFLEKGFLNLYGDDLAATDIQRGRDHGLPSYNNVRELCGMQKANDFSDLEDDISQQNIDMLGNFYESVDDVDLYVGALLEKKDKSSSIMGPTCTCVIEEQFRRWKDGDRFWFEHGKQVGSFTHEQLHELKKVSLSRLICDNGDVTRMQPFAYWTVGEGNELQPCSEIPKVSFLPWKV